MPVNPHKRRCAATNVDGRPCRSWAVPHSEPPRCAIHLPHVPRCSARTAAGAPCRARPIAGQALCSVHAGHTAPRPGATPDHRICTATVEGRRCSVWAVWGSDPPLCGHHARNTAAGRRAQGGRRRCQARTAAGKRCTNWALHATRHAPGPSLCGVHAGLVTTPRDADYTRQSGPLSRTARARRAVRRGCSAPTAAGERCGHWALRHSDPPLCWVHARGGVTRLPGAADRARGRQCSARNLAGERCRHWAERHSSDPDGPPFCWLHAAAGRHGRLSHGYYRRVSYFTKSQQAAIAAVARDGPPLAAELLIVRLKLRGLLAYLSRPQLSPAERLRVTPLAFNGVRAVARLLLAQRALGSADWTPGTAGGAGHLLAGILQEEE